MKYSLKLATIAIITFCSSIGHAESDSRIRFHIQEAIASGSGCQLNQNAFLTMNGNKLMAYLTDMVINLGQGSANSSMAARSTCLIRMPADVPVGYYISEMTDYFDGTVYKTAGATGTISIRSSLYGFPTSPLTLTLRQGQRLNQPVRSIATNTFNAQATPSWVAGWCSRNRQASGLLETSISVSGQIQTRNDALSIAFGFSDHGVEIGNIKLSRCAD